MLAARDDLAEKLGEVAVNRGFTLFGMVNDLLELAVKADGMGVSLEETVASHETIRAVKDASFTLVLESLLYDTAEIAYEKAKDKTLQTWFEAGVWVAKRYLTREVKEPFAAVGRDLKAFSWNISEFTVEKLKKDVSVRVLSPRFSESYTLLFTQFLEGILETFGYTVTYKEVSRGNIHLKAVEGES
jgi:hypothetical protein